MRSDVINTNLCYAFIRVMGGEEDDKIHIKVCGTRNDKIQSGECCLSFRQKIYTLAGVSIYIFVDVVIDISM